MSVLFEGEWGSAEGDGSKINIHLEEMSEVEEVVMGSKWGGFPYQWRLEYTKNVRELSSLTFLSITSINLKES